MADRLPLFVLLAAALALAACATTKPKSDESAPQQSRETYEMDEILAEAEGLFGEGAEGLGDVIAKTFDDQGQPTAYIVGEEASGAIGVGARYGVGELRFKNGETRRVYWQGASIGFDAGGNASKVFILAYNLHAWSSLMQRFPGVEGTVYFVAGVGVNYAQAGEIVVAPVRAGVGWRAGANVGTLKFTEEETVNPF